MLRAQGGLPSDRQLSKRCSSLQAEGRTIHIRYVTVEKVIAKGCKLEARHRARHHERMPMPMIPIPPAGRSARPRATPVRCRRRTGHLKAEYVAWLDSLPDSLHATPPGEALQAIADPDLDALAGIDPPRGYGRD
jgi:hypothetical protein